MFTFNFFRKTSLSDLYFSANFPKSHKMLKMAFYFIKEFKGKKDELNASKNYDPLSKSEKSPRSSSTVTQMGFKLRQRCHQSRLSVCTGQIDFAPTLQNKGPVPQVLKQVVNQSC